MSREVHVRFCGGLEVKFLRSTWPFNPVLEVLAQDLVVFKKRSNDLKMD